MADITDKKMTAKNVFISSPSKCFFAACKISAKGGDQSFFAPMLANVQGEVTV